jgi:large subunit ribosomal protein L13
MLPKGPLGRQIYKKLKVYAGAEHPHAAQQPKPVKFVTKA